MTDQLELCCIEATLIREIFTPSLKRLHIAQTYCLALMSGHFRRIDWAFVNQAIIDRWSPQVLVWIKGQAWSGKCFKEKRIKEARSR